MIKEIILKAIKTYQIFFSPDHGIWKRGVTGCRFYPSCSEYAKQAIEKHGAKRGVIMGMKRIKKCHPWNQGGYDPIK